MASEPAPGAATPPRVRRRLSLGRSPRRLSFERRLRGWLWLLALPATGLAAALLYSRGAALATGAVLLGLLLLGWATAVSLLLEQIVRPLQTLSNVLAALREDDYSFRARGGRRDDAVGDLALEVNALAALLQTRRSGDMEASALLEQVMTAMPSPVLAFAPDGTLRLLNSAARRAFSLPKAPAGFAASQLGLEHVLAAAHDDLLSIPPATQEGHAPTRWIVQRSSFRLRGVPHALVVLSDVSTALREEERLAWKRLIRVISHEVNNSLTPIKSIAGSLRNHLSVGGSVQDWERGLAVIESRAESLNRFLQGYSQLAGLPSPRYAMLAVDSLLERVCHLETRVAVELEPGPPLVLAGDPDQLQQALINLIKNGAEAALSAHDTRNGEPTQDPAVSVSWHASGADVVILIRDNGAGIANEGNLFVPFYTTKVNGTGIGLVLALQILEAHGGTVRLRNRATANGCAAEVRLPRAVLRP